MICLVAYYYGWSLDQVGEFSPVQFVELVENVGRIQKLFNGTGDGASSSNVNWGNISRLRKVGLSKGLL